MLTIEQARAYAAQVLDLSMLDTAEDAGAGGLAGQHRRRGRRAGTQ
jgi:hypothetical protein